MLALHQLDAPKPAPSQAEQLRALALEQRTRGKK
jgi:hypothetical protein